MISLTVWTILALVLAWGSAILLTPKEIAALMVVEHQLPNESYVTVLMGPEDSERVVFAHVERENAGCSCESNSCQCCVTHPDATDALHCIGIGARNGKLHIIATIADYIHQNFSYEFPPSKDFVTIAKPCTDVTPKKIAPWVKLELCTIVNVTKTNNTMEVCITQRFYLWGWDAAVMVWKCAEISSTGVDLRSSFAANNVAVTFGGEKRGRGLVNFRRKAAMVEVSKAFKDLRRRAIRSMISTDDSLPKGHPTERINWEPLAKGEIPYLAVLYQHPKPERAVRIRKWMKSPFLNFNKMLAYAAKEWFFDGQEVDLVDTTVGQGCGGALVTPSRVLTLCTCIRTFYIEHKQLKKKPGPISPLDIQSSEIYVAFGCIHTQFTADRQYRLDTVPENFMKSSSCFKEIESELKSESIVSYLRAAMVVMPLTPEVIDLKPATRYHPLLQPESHKSKAQSSVNLAVFGMSKREGSIDIFDDLGNSYNPEEHAEKIFLARECTHDDFCNIKDIKCHILKKNRGKLKCFSYTGNFQLCGGCPGFPVIINGSLAGISTTSLDCMDGTVLVRFLDRKTRAEIEEYIGPSIRPMSAPNDTVTSPNNAHARARQASHTETAKLKGFKPKRRILNSALFLELPDLTSVLTLPIILSYQIPAW